MWLLCSSPVCLELGAPEASVEAGEAELSPRVWSGRRPGLDSKIPGSKLEITPLLPTSCATLGKSLYLSVSPVEGHSGSYLPKPPERVKGKNSLGTKYQEPQAYLHPAASKFKE